PPARCRRIPAAGMRRPGTLPSACIARRARRAPAVHTRARPRPVRLSHASAFPSSTLAVLVGEPGSPLRLVDALVRLEHLALAIAGKRIEASRQMMVDEHVLRARDTEPGLFDPPAVVVVLEEADAEGFIHVADTLPGVASHRHAEECRRADRDPLARMGARIPCRFAH